MWNQAKYFWDYHNSSIHLICISEETTLGICGNIGLWSWFIPPPIHPPFLLFQELYSTETAGRCSFHSSKYVLASRNQQFFCHLSGSYSNICWMLQVLFIGWIIITKSHVDFFQFALCNQFPYVIKIYFKAKGAYSVKYGWKWWCGKTNCPQVSMSF